jgi:hypothetical protein
VLAGRRQPLTIEAHESIIQVNSYLGEAEFIRKVQTLGDQTGELAQGTLTLDNTGQFTSQALGTRDRASSPEAN